MISRKSRKSQGTGRVLRGAGEDGAGGPSLLTWPFRRLWSAIERFLVRPTRRLASGIGRVVALAASEIAWPFRRAWWAIEKSVVWPVADRFSRRKTREPRVRQPAPLAWIGATALVMVTAGAVTAAYYFYKEAETSGDPAFVVDAPVVTETTPAQVIPPVEDVEDSPASLQGATPDFDATPGKAGKKKGNTRVKPAEVPKEPALKVAHRFASSFVSYEVGESQPKVLARTSTPKLARELADRPPRQPSKGKVPKARVLNVVEGKKDGRRLTVSVALQRSGAATELRLSMVKGKDRTWKVSEVLG